MTRRPFFRPLVTWLEDRTTPTASFAAQQPFNVGNGQTNVAVADFNRDGKPDVVAANSTDNTVSVLLNTTPVGGAPAAAAQVTFPVGTTPTRVAVADVNGDGRPDVITANSADNTVSVLLNTSTPLGNPTPTFAAQVTFPTGTGPQAVTSADVTGDGRPDLVVANTTAGTVGVLVNTTAYGATTPTFAAQQTFAVAGANNVSAGDVNGDGRPDLVAVNNAGNNLAVLLNTTPLGNATASFGAAQTFATQTAPTAAEFGDINGDGRPDLVAVNNGSNTVSVLLNTTAAGATTPTFATGVAFAVDVNPLAISPSGAAVADVTGDGRPDIITGNSSVTVTVLENTTAVGATTPTFAAQQIFGAGLNPRAVAVTDFNQDGRADLVATADGGVIGVLSNNLAGYAVPFSTVAAGIPGQGTRVFNTTTNAFTQIGSGQPNILAAGPNGEVVANYPGAGVWLYRPTVGFVRINGVDAKALAVDPYGNIFVSFAGYGTFRYLLATGQYTLIGTGVADKLAADPNGNAVASFPGGGVYVYRPTTGFVKINGIDATALAFDGYGSVFVGFAGYGTFRYSLATGQYNQIAPVAANKLAADALGNVVGNFAGGGVYLYRPTSGAFLDQINGTDALAVGIDTSRGVYVSFAGFGAYEYRQVPNTYTQLGSGVPTVLSVR